MCQLLSFGFTDILILGQQNFPPKLSYAFENSLFKMGSPTFRDLFRHKLCHFGHQICMMAQPNSTSNQSVSHSLRIWTLTNTLVTPIKRTLIQNLYIYPYMNIYESTGCLRKTPHFLPSSALVCNFI